MAQVLREVEVTREVPVEVVHEQVVALPVLKVVELGKTHAVAGGFVPEELATDGRLDPRTRRQPRQGVMPHATAKMLVCGPRMGPRGVPPHGPAHGVPPHRPAPTGHRAVDLYMDPYP